jgi:hypothetical protein
MLRALCVVGAEDRAREELCRTAYRRGKRILDTWDLRLTRLAHNLQRSISNAYEGTVNLTLRSMTKADDTVKMAAGNRLVIRSRAARPQVHAIV